MRRHQLMAAGLVVLALAGCTDRGANTADASAGTAGCPEVRTALEGPCVRSTAGLRLNDLQAVGTHNSYKIAIPEIELALIAAQSPEAAQALDYGHLPLHDQLDMGMRQIELDVIRDPEGGLYADPLLPKLVAGRDGAVAYDPAGMDAPGYKVLHTQDLDPRSHCKTFKACLAQLDAWSLANPDHVPILVLVNLKSGGLDVPGTVVAPGYDAAAFDALDGELTETLSRSRYIAPDDVRGDGETLREAVLSGAWPDLEESRGRFLFALDTGADHVTTYLRDTPSLEGRPMFVNSLSEDADHAAYFTMNDPLADGEMITARVAAGFLVRTRADANTQEARTGNTARLQGALSSGAQYISTDYPTPRTEWSDYTARLPGDVAARCNPVRRRPACDPVGEGARP